MGVFLKIKDPSTGWGSICFFGLGVIVALVQFHPKSSYLKLNDHGFEVKGLFRSSFTKWSEVKNFRLGQIKGNKLIFFDYTKSHTKWKQGKKLAKFLSGNEGAIRSTYNISSEKLVKLMKEYKLKNSQSLKN